jgi:hypothetical protein
LIVKHLIIGDVEPGRIYSPAASWPATIQYEPL